MLLEFCHSGQCKDCSKPSVHLSRRIPRPRTSYCICCESSCNFHHFPCMGMDGWYSTLSAIGSNVLLKVRQMLSLELFNPFGMLILRHDTLGMPGFLQHFGRGKPEAESQYCGHIKDVYVENLGAFSISRKRTSYALDVTTWVRKGNDTF